MVSGGSITVQCSTLCKCKSATLLVILPPATHSPELSQGGVYPFRNDNRFQNVIRFGIDIRFQNDIRFGNDNRFQNDIRFGNDNRFQNDIRFVNDISIQKIYL